MFKSWFIFLKIKCISISVILMICIDKPVVYCQPHIFCSVIQCNMGVLGTQLNVLTTCIRHSEWEAHSFEFFWSSFIVSNVHKPRNKILINLWKQETQVKVSLLASYSSISCIPKAVHHVPHTESFDQCLTIIHLTWIQSSKMA